MKRGVPLAVFTVLVLAMVFVQQPLGACFRCDWKIVCQFTTDCEVVEFCAETKQLQAGQTECMVSSWGTCSTSGQVCRWA